MTPKRQAAAWTALVVLVVAAAYETLVALEVIPLGEVPGEGPPGGTLVGVCALVAFLLAVGLCIDRALGAASDRAPVWPALAPAAFLFTLARWYAPDPYYLPTIRRFNTNTVHGPWIAVLALAAALAAVIAYRWPRAGAVASAGVLVVTGLTAWWLPIGK